MAEYIEREAAIDATYALHFKDLIQEALRNIPAADVRPVVLCRDCKHNNACLTQAFVEEESKAPFDRNTFFCADGERGSYA